MNTVSINAEQQLYVIDDGEGCTCFGFAKKPAITPTRSPTR